MGGTSLTAPEKLAWLRLIRSDRVGPVTFFQLLKLYGSAEKALNALPDMAARGGGKKPFKAASKADAEKELAQCAAQNIQVICYAEGAYPTLLRTIPDAPPILFVRGHSHLWHKPTVAMVGARNASAAGQNLARAWAESLSQAGVTVVSGLARGIDTAAHMGSLNRGTIAVVAGGVNYIYPPENKDLHEKIASLGAVVGENSPDMVPQATHFPRRNRIISGLASVVLVVEANYRSGSLITARLAGEQGREVMAVPGSPLDPRCAGTNQLLKDGAALAASVEDVLALCQRPILTENTPPDFSVSVCLPDEAALRAGRQKILELLSPVPTGIDDLLRLAEVTPAVLHMVLLELQLAGRLERHAGNMVSMVQVF